LRQLRRAKGLTQRQLAGSSLSVSYVSLLEAGKRSPAPQTIRILANALSCDVHELVEGGDPEQPLTLVLAQADLALAAGQITGALERYEQVLAAAPGDAALLRRARLGQAQSLQRTGRLTDAAKVYERCVRLGEADPANESSLHVYTGWCRCLYELGELVRAADIGRTALAEFEAAQASESELSIRLLATVALIWYELGDLREAERLLDDGLQRASRVRSPTARGAILWNASVVAYERGRHQQALELAEEALCTFRGGTSRHDIGRLLAARGYLLIRTDPPRTGEAFASFQDALGELTETADPVDKAYILTELCYVHLARDDVAQAVRAAEQARGLLGSTAQLERARATTALAVALTAQDEPIRAHALFAEAATVLDHLGATRHAARSWIELAHALADAGHFTDAIAAYENAARAMNIDGPRWRQRRAATRLPPPGE
jgi:tetratricopeptide (TPR) repeat protein/DNA-binding XRE family transcriptional regulator